MCGRFNLRTPAEQLIEVFDLVRSFEIDPRYNIAPTQPVLAVRLTDNGREPDFLHWGLVPFWADDPKIGSRMINARSETVATKPAFRAAFKRRRCLIPVDGFYEWKKTDAKNKQPFHIEMRDKQPFAFAGLWETWEKDGASLLESCTILTTEPNELMAEIHNRMPVILEPEDYGRWLDPTVQDRTVLEPLLTAFPADKMQAYPVSRIVGNARNETPECVEPLD